MPNLNKNSSSAARMNCRQTKSLRNFSWRRSLEMDWNKNSRPTRISPNNTLRSLAMHFRPLHHAQVWMKTPYPWSQAIANRLQISIVRLQAKFFRRRRKTYLKSLKSDECQEFMIAKEASKNTDRINSKRNKPWRHKPSSTRYNKTTSQHLKVLPIAWIESKSYSKLLTFWKVSRKSTPSPYLNWSILTTHSHRRNASTLISRPYKTS